MARLGATATLVAPRDHAATTLWPDEGRGPLGAELVLSTSRGLGELARAALDVAVDRAADAPDGGVVLVRVPPAWLRDGREGRVLRRRVLLFTATDSRDLLEAYGLAKQVLCCSDDAQVGITIHGARTVPDAERAFRHLAGVAARHLGRDLVSYGLLVDDLHIYRAIVARRPIGLEHPQSSAARALRDVAQLLLEDMRKTALA